MPHPEIEGSGFSRESRSPPATPNSEQSDGNSTLSRLTLWSMFPSVLDAAARTIGTESAKVSFKEQPTPGLDGDAEYIEDHRHDLIPAARIARSLVSNEGFQRDRASNASGGHASELLSLMGRLAKNRLTLGPIAGSVLSSLISGQSLRVQEASSGRGNSTEDLLSLFVRIANHGRDAVNLLDSLSGQGQTAEPVASDCREPEHSDPHEDEEGTPNDGRVHGKVTAAKLERELRITQEVCKKMGIPVPQELRDKMGLPVARLDRNGGIVRDVLERTRLVPSDEEGSNSIAEDRGGQEDRNVKADSLAVATHTIAAVHDIALSIKEAMINEGEDD